MGRGGRNRRKKAGGHHAGQAKQVRIGVRTWLRIQRERLEGLFHTRRIHLNAGLRRLLAEQRGRGLRRQTLEGRVDQSAGVQRKG